MNKLHSSLVVVFVAGMALAVSGCLTLSSMHSATPTPKGKTEFGLATGMTGAIVDGESAAVPTITEFQIRHGLTENLDFGARLYIPGLMLDLNWALINSDSFALSLNPGFTGMYFSVNDSSVFFGTGWLNILLDVVKTESLRLTVGPKLGIFFAAGDIATDSDSSLGFGSDATALVGGMLGLRMQLTEGFALMPEFNFYFSTETEAMLYNASLVFLF